MTTTGTTRQEPIWTADGTFAWGRTVYQVEKNTAEDGNDFAAYRLTGPRGAEYVLCRNKPNPHMLFAINGRRFTASTPFRDEWFTDRNGTLEHIR